MLVVLKKPMLIWVDGTVKRVGGDGAVGEDLQDKCKCKMQNFLRLFVQSVRAEFPDFEIVHHLSAFNVSISAQRHRSTSRCESQTNSLKALATFLDVDADAVVENFNAVWHIAELEAKKHPDASCCDVWRQVLNLDFGGRRQPLIDKGGLRRVLEFVTALSAVTSGCEQSFSKAQWAASGRRLWQTEDLEAEEIKLLADHIPESQQGDLFALAQQAWVRVGYGKRRRSGPLDRPRARIDRGIRRITAPRDDTEAGFIAKRRRAVSQMAASVPASTNYLTAPPRQAEWTDEMQQEEDFTIMKRFKHLVDAVWDGSQNPAELSVPLLELIVNEIATRKAKGLAETRRQQRELRSSSQKPPRFSHCKYFIEPHLRARLGHVFCNRLAQIFPNAKAVPRHEATVFIVHMTSLDKIPQKSGWAAALRGGSVVTATYAASNGNDGLCLTFESQMKKRKFAHITAAFESSFPSLTALVRKCTPAWIHLDAAGLGAIVARFKGPRRAELLVLASAAEARHKPGVLTGLAQVHSEPVARRVFLSKVDRPRCS